MFVHISEERRRVPIGLVADICPFCDAVGTLEIARLESRMRVMFIPLKWSLVHHEAACPGCGTAFKVRPQDYTRFHPETAASFEDLVAQTNPALVERLRQRAALEARVASGKITDDVREEVILRAFRDVGRAVRAPGWVANLLLWACLLLFAPMIGAAVASAAVPPISGTPAPPTPGAAPGRPNVHPRSSPLHDALFVVVLALCVLVIIRLALWLRSMWMLNNRRYLFDAVARRVAPVAPTRDQLLCAIYLLRGERNPLCRLASAAKLANLVQRRLRVATGTSPNPG